MKLLQLSLLLVAIALVVGCDGGSDGPDIDFGDNNPALYIAIGDSITEGEGTSGYPAALSGLLGVPVENRGDGGAHSSAAYDAARGALRAKPGWLLILYGSNDAIHDRSAAGAVDNLREVVRMCIAQKTVPVIATPPPMFEGHAGFDGNVSDIAEGIRLMAAEEGARLVDLNLALVGRSDLFQRDGLHPTEEGNVVIANEFYGQL